MIKAWWSDDMRWFCIRNDDGVGQVTISLRMEDARDVLNGLASVFNEGVEMMEPQPAPADSH